jgi:nuclear pore complex protein Nup54
MNFRDQQQQFIANFNQLLGNRPNIVVNIDSIKAQSDKKTQINVYVEEKSTTSNETRRILATELINFLNQPQTKQHLTTQLSVESCVALVLPDEDQLKEYLDNPPKGIDPRMWKQAKADNPDSKKLIPVPMIGFQELKWRLKCQEQETDTHHTYLSNVEKEITALKQRHANTSAKIMEHRRKFAELSHRILKIIVKQESTRKLGQALSPEEEIIRNKLENMQALVSAPTQFKGRLSELLSQMRMQRNQWAHVGATAEYTLDKDSSEEMKSFLGMQQRAMNFLIETVNRDLKDLAIIREGMQRMTPEYPQQVFN